LNRFFGPVVNAAMGIGNNVSQKLSVFARTFVGSVQPEIVTRVGAGDYTGARRMSNRVCIYSCSLGLLIAAPLVVNMQRLLVLWLKNPAEYAVEIAVIVVARSLGYHIISGFSILIHATGRIKGYTLIVGACDAVRFVLLWVLLWNGMPLVKTLWLVMFYLPIIVLQSVVLIARQSLGKEISIRHYVFEVLAPACLMIAASFAFSFGFKALHGDSIVAILSCLAGNALLVALLFWLVIGADERTVIRTKIAAIKAIATGLASVFLRRCGRGIGVHD